MSALELDSVSKHYDGASVLSTLGLRFPENRITAVIGPSGCGKSTLLKLCNGLVVPDSGRVCAFGKPLDYAALPQIRKRMGFAVQGTALFPHLTARDNITLLARLERWEPAQIETRLDELLALTRLQADQLQRFPHELSGGQQQRVGLCRAMMLRPEVLLLDEPFAAIDPITRSDIHRQLLELHRAEPTTSLLVTHDMREALHLADHIVVMGNGSLLCNESKASLLRGREDTEPEALLHDLLQGAH